MKYKDVDIELKIDIEDYPHLCPRVRVIKPVFNFDSSYPVKVSGLVVIDGITPTTYDNRRDNKDFIYMIYNRLAENIPVYDMNKNYDMSVLGEDECDVVKDYDNLEYKCSGVFNEVQFIINDKLKNNSVMCGGAGIVMLESFSGIKTWCNVIKNSELKGIVYISQETSDNLLGSSKGFMCESKGIKEARRLRLIPLEKIRNKKGYGEYLFNYKVITCGDVITLDDKKFRVKSTTPSIVCLLESNSPGHEIDIYFK